MVVLIVICVVLLAFGVIFAFREREQLGKVLFGIGMTGLISIGLVVISDNSVSKYLIKNRITLEEQYQNMKNDDYNSILALQQVLHYNQTLIKYKQQIIEHPNFYHPNADEILNITLIEY